MQSYAMDYQLTGKSSSLAAAKSAISSFSRKSGDGRDIQRVDQLSSLALAYDLVQQNMTSAEDAAARYKLAELSDQVYYDLNHNDASGRIDNDIQCVDYHFKAYAILGVAGMAMSDYTGSLPHGSNASDWLNAGTKYLFIRDPLHSAGGSMFSNCIDPDGLDLVAGDYRGYYYGQLLFLSQAYSHYFGRSILQDYPIVYNWVMAPRYYYMPNGYDTNRGSAGQVKMLDGRTWMNLLNSSDQSIIWKYYSDLVNDHTLPYSRSFAVISDYHPQTEIAISTVKDYSSVAYAVPTFTSRLNSWDYQVFRNFWNSSSPWLSFTTFRSKGTENRFLAHDDQLSFEYYDKADYLLADSGEVKYLKSGYGPIFAKGHNDIMINDSQSANMAGVYKGNTNLGLVHNATLFSVQKPGMELAESGIVISMLEGTNSNGERTSSSVSISPIRWQRAIVYPNKEYFVVLDYIQNSVGRKIDTLFHPSSFSHTPSISSSNVGVDGVALSVEGATVDWASQAFNSEASKGTGREIRWNTTSSLGQALQTQLFSVPDSEITVEKYWGRVGGHEGTGYDWGGVNEIYMPIVHYKVSTNAPLYRISAFDTQYKPAIPWTYSQLSLSGGNGNALKVTNGTWADRITYSDGSYVTFDSNYATDAQYSVSREVSGVVKSIFLRNGKKFSFAGVSYVSAANKMDYLYANSTGNNWTISGGVSGNTNVTLHFACDVDTAIIGNSTSISRLGNWDCINSANIWLVMNPGTEYTINSGGA